MKILASVYLEGKKTPRSYVGVLEFETVPSIGDELKMISNSPFDTSALKSLDGKTCVITEVISNPDLGLPPYRIFITK